jgi:predicted ATP-grasp superfamily ATP-dependent carboligase
MAHVLVLDAHLRPSLAVIRSLGRRGFHVTTASERFFPMGPLSKYSRQNYLLPNPRKHPVRYLDSLVKILQNDSYDCVFVSHTSTAYLLSRHQQELSLYTKIPTPCSEVFEVAYQKEKTLQKALQLGIPVPKIYEADQVQRGDVTYPVIVKSLRRHGMGITLCGSASELRRCLHKMTKVHGPCIVQDYIPNGGEIGVYALFNGRSQPRAAIMQRRLRTYYPYGGISTLRETIRDDTLMHQALDFLQRLSWTGVAMVEFRIDQRNRTPYLLEINPRFWGSLELSIYAGIDFPFLLYRMLMEGDIEPVFAYQAGVKARWWFGDLHQFLFGSGTFDNTKFFSQQVHDDIISKDDMLPVVYGSFSLFTRS